MLGADFDDYRRDLAADASTDGYAADLGAGGRPTGGGSDASGGEGGQAGWGTGGSGAGATGGTGGGGGSGTGATAGTSGAAGGGGQPVTDAGRNGGDGPRVTDASFADTGAADALVADLAPIYDVGDTGRVTVDGAIQEAGPSTPRDGGITGGGCTPGQVHHIAACGNCGQYLQMCNAQGVWDPPYCRQEPNVCSPGSTEHRSCAGGGTQVATCTPSCTWSLGACVHPECTVGQMDVQPCSLCGTQTRVCVAGESGPQWGPFSACTGQGVCAPGASDVTTCGKCGTRSRTCDTACTWEAWGACQGEGECPAGATETQDCQILLPILVLGKRTRSCDASCSWGPYGPCK